MNRRQFIAAGCAASLLAHAGMRAEAPRLKTRWIVRGSEGLRRPLVPEPAVGRSLLCGSLQAARSPRSRRACRPTRWRRSEPQGAGGEGQHPAVAVPRPSLLGRTGPDIADLIGSLDHAETCFARLCRQVPIGASESWRASSSRRRRCSESILVAMRDAGFAEFRSAISIPRRRRASRSCAKSCRASTLSAGSSASPAARSSRRSKCPARILQAARHQGDRPEIPVGDRLGRFGGDPHRRPRTAPPAGRHGRRGGAGGARRAAARIPCSRGSQGARSRLRL